MFRCHTLNQFFNPAGREFDSPATIVTNEMQMIGLIDDRFIARHTMQLRLPDEAGRQEDLDRPVDRCQADAVAFREKRVTDFFDGRMAFGFKQYAPDKRPLGGLL